MLADPPSPVQRKRKSSEVLARKILDEIIAEGWKTGTNLGTEPELTVRYDVSRATFREAVRQLELHGAATMKRGSGGGLVIAEPPKAAAVNAMTTFMQLTHVTFADQHELREQLEVRAARLAAERATPAMQSRLQEALKGLAQANSFAENVAANMRIRVALAEASGNPSLALFLQALNGVLYQILTVVSADTKEGQADREMSGRFKHDLVNAILARDPEEAESLVKQDNTRRLLMMTDLMGRQGRTAVNPLDPLRPPDSAPQKLSEVIARKLARDISLGRFVEGHALGNEAELQEQYKVSRAVLREAIRQLEPHGVVRTQSGFRGGLVVGVVQMDYTVELARLYLETTNIAILHLWETQALIERFAVQKLARSCSPSQAKVLETHLAELERTDASTFLPASSRFHQAIAVLTGNRALALFDTVLLRSGELAYPPVAQGSIAWLIRIHRDLVTAISARDERGAMQAISAIYERSRVWIGGTP